MGTMYVTDPGAYVYQVETIFGDGEEDESYCSAIGCIGENFHFATKGRKKSDTEWSVGIQGSNNHNSDFVVLCPLPSMTIRIENMTCVDPDGDGDFGNPVTVDISRQFGPGLKLAEDFTPDSCLAIRYEIVCTGTAEEINLLELSQPSESDGFNNRPYTDNDLKIIYSCTEALNAQDCFCPKSKSLAA